MNPTARLLAVLVSLGLPAAGVQLRHRALEPLAFPLARLDPVGPGYAPAGDTPLAPEVLAGVLPDAYLQRAYLGAGQTPFGLYLAFYAGQRAQGAHSPEVCYPAQGYEVIEARSTSVPVADGGFVARLARVARGHRSEWVLWWFQPADRWARGDALEQLLRIYDGLRGRPQFAFVRLSTPALQGDRPPARLVAFASDLAPRVREIVERAQGARPRLSSLRGR